MVKYLQQRSLLLPYTLYLSLVYTLMGFNFCVAFNTVFSKLINLEQINKHDIDSSTFIDEFMHAL